MIKLLTRAAAAAVLLFVFLLETPVPARGQGVGIYRGRQGRRVGRIPLPTPPFNPNAGVLDSRDGRGKDSPKTTRRRPARRSVKAAVPNTPRRRRARRARNARRVTPRVTAGNQR
ncbi:MAG: hypothetical protein ABW208_20285 [Pyrinomonadaceae bacterium]